MHPEPGIYRIEGIPPPPLPPVQIIGVELDAPLLALPTDCPPPPGVRDWKIAFAPHLEGEGPQFVITAAGFQPLHAGWGRVEDELNVDVLYSPNVKNWTIMAARGGGYVIAVPTQLPDVILAVTIDDERLVIKSYPIGSDDELPAWRLTPGNSDQLGAGQPM